MKKSLIIAAMASMALASCTSDDFLGEKVENGSTEAINFGGQGNHITRAATTGSAAAAILGNEFRVLGTITKAGTTNPVFDNYVVKYDETNMGTKNPDGSYVDSTNVFGWTYLGLTSKGITPAEQYIKYWDLQATKYDFVAFSGISDTKRVGSTESNTFDIDRTSMQKLFFSDRVIADYSGTQGVQYGNKVGFTFNRAAARVRVGFYETVPGYAVANVRFYFDDNLLTTDVRKAEPNAVLNAAFPVSGQYEITYNAKNVAIANFIEGGQKDRSLNLGSLQYEKDETGRLSLSDNGKTGIVGESKPQFLATSSAKPTWAKGPATLDGEDVALSDWQSIMPYPAYGAKDDAGEYINRRLTLRVDYDLVPLDGGPVINVYNASAVVPYEWTQWKPNYAYTYIFKISDQTSGSTIPPYIDIETDSDGDGIPDFMDPDTDTDGDGIPDIDDPDDDGDGIPDDQDFPGDIDNPDVSVIPDPDTENPNPQKPAVSPIVFDAEVSAIEDYNQETITGFTTLGGNAITTYSSTSKVTDAAEYAVGETIVVSSPSHGQWKVAFSTSEVNEKSVNDDNSYSYTVIGGATEGTQTINEASVYTAEFKVSEAGYYIVWLRYLPTGMADIDANYVDIFKVVKTH